MSDNDESSITPGHEHTADNTDTNSNEQNRRRFLAGSAVAAATAGMAGITGSATPAMALAPEMGVIPQIGTMGPWGLKWGLHHGMTTLGDQPYIHGYGFAGLPFPTDPGAFMSSALKAVFGVFQRCLCITPQAVFDFVGLGGGTQTARMEGGLGVGVGGGQSNLVKQILSVVLNPTEHIARGVNGLLGGIDISHDGTRPMPPSTMLPLDPARIFRKFLYFANPFSWPGIIAKFFTNPMSIWSEFLGFFFPVRQEMNFNIEVRCEKFPGVVLVNKQNIKMQAPSLGEFPPRNAGYAPSGIVELVDKQYPHGPTLVVIKQFNATVNVNKTAPPLVYKPPVYKPDGPPSCTNG